MMHTRKFRLILLLFGFACIGKPKVSEPVPNNEITYHLKEGTQAYQEKNFKDFLTHYQKASSLSPRNPNLLYLVARGHALLGQHDKALSILETLAAMDLVYNIEEQNDLASLKEMPKFSEILSRMNQTQVPIYESETAFTFLETDLLTEGIAYDPVTEAFFVSSVHRRKILRIAKNGTVDDFVSEQQDGIWGVFGIKIDAERRILWACSATMPQMKDFREEEQGRSGVFRYNLDTGVLEKTYLLPSAETEHVLGDLAVNAKGEVFFTDSISGEIFMISPQNDSLEVFLSKGTFRSPQGIDFSQDETLLFVADYTAGLFVIDLETKNIKILSTPETLPIYGIDGLLQYQGSLIALQNGVYPPRVVQLFLDPEKKQVQKTKVLERNSPLLVEPTLGTLIDNSLYYIASSQWPNFDRKGNLLPREELKEAVILRLELSLDHNE